MKLQRMMAMGMFDSGGSRLQSVLSYSPCAYYRLLETSGTSAADASGNGYNGTYNNVTLANTAGPFGGFVPLFSTTGTVNMNASAAVGATSGAEGAIVIAVKIPLANWTDGQVAGAIRIFNSATNYIQIYKSNTNNRLTWRRTIGADNKLISKDSMTATGWLVLGLDWSESANQLKAYYQGVQEGSTLTAPAWGVTAPDEISVGAIGLAGGNEFNAWIGEVALFSSPLGAGGHLELATKFFLG
jgi:hypothetical protein